MAASIPLPSRPLLAAPSPKRPLDDPRPAGGFVVPNPLLMHHLFGLQQAKPNAPTPCRLSPMEPSVDTSLPALNALPAATSLSGMPWILYNSAPQREPKRRKVARSHFTDEQKKVLNRYFNERNHMKNYKVVEIKEIERETGLSEHQIRIYFQNKRARSKGKDSPPITPEPLPSSAGSSPILARSDAPTGSSNSLPARQPGSPVPPSAFPKAPVNMISLLNAAPELAAEPTRPELFPATSASQVSLQTLAKIDALSQKLGIDAAETVEAKELMCSVFDGNYLPASQLQASDAPALVAACCLHIVRRQNMKPITIAACEEAIGGRVGRLEPLLSAVVANMRIVFNDVDAAVFVPSACKQLPVGDRWQVIAEQAIAVTRLARKSGPPSLLKNPASLAGAAILVSAKANGVAIGYGEVADVLKVGKWSVKSKEEELEKLLSAAIGRKAL